MKTITLTQLGIAGAIQAISKHFDEQIAKAGKPKRRNPDREAISMLVSRDFQEIELALEILDYRPAEQGGMADERLPESVELEAFTLNGREFHLTETERERATELALDHIHRQQVDAEESRLDLGGRD